MNGGRRSVGEMRKEDELRVWSSSESGNASKGLFLFGGGKATRGSVARASVAGKSGRDQEGRTRWCLRRRCAGSAAPRSIQEGG
jgi:hypothetical protein